MKKKRKVKKNVYYILIAALVIFIAIFGCFKYYKYVTSNEYKLGKIGYSEEEVSTLLHLDQNKIDKLLKMNYDKNISKFVKQDYFIFSNLNSYLKYYNKNKSEKLKEVVSLINTKSNYEWYDKKTIKKTDTKKGILMLVNKFNYLDKNYKPTNIVEISNYYSYANNSIIEEVYLAYKEMWKKAKEDDLTLIVTSSYRNYETQEYLWNKYADSKSEEWADSLSARAGYSEHQSGLALDIVTYNVVMNDFEKTDEFKWLLKNAYKYGFILRYPKDKKNITGYDYESWHYRYVGKDVAKTIHEKNITFDEYYAYYIENGQKWKQ